LDKNESGHITQKDLLKLLFDQAQHNATREELNALEARITNQINGQNETLDKRFELTDRRFEVIDKKFEAIDKRFDSIDKRFEAVDKRFDAVDKKFEAMDKKFEAVDKRFDRLSWLIISTLIGICASLALQLLK
jgi:chaperonin cofactor prefoldin